MSEPVTNVQTDNINALNSNNNTSDCNSDSGVQLHDAENNIGENFDILIDIKGSDINLSNGSGCMISDFSNEYTEDCELMNVQTKDEEFHDAVQFFKDPSSFNFFENAVASDTITTPSSIRSSLYMSFDPLHAKFGSEPIRCNVLQEIAEVDVVPEVPDISKFSESVDVVPEVPDISKLSEPVNISPRPSRGSVLISFDSPVNGDVVESDAIPEAESDTLCDALCEPPKHYTENEYQEAMKTRELMVQDTFMQKERELEQNIQGLEAKLLENEEKLKKQNLLCSTFVAVLEELSDTAFAISEQKKQMQENYEKEIDKLREDLKTSMEDLQSVENTFADFHKRYEQCKGMLKVYTQNEDNLKQQLEKVNLQLQEKDEMYKALQTRTEEMVDKANTEVANAKRSGEAQVAVLKAQLKKAELKISSLESDVKHIKCENGQLNTVIDELTQNLVRDK